MNEDKESVQDIEKRVALDILLAIEAHYAYYGIDEDLQVVLDEKAKKYHILNEKGEKI